MYRSWRRTEISIEFQQEDLMETEDYEDVGLDMCNNKMVRKEIGWNGVERIQLLQDRK
jgi:hypothetical protein